MGEQLYGISGNYAHIDGTGALKTTAAVTASVDFSPIAGSPTQSPVGGSVMMIGGIDATTGSITFLRSTNNILDVNATATTSFDPVGGRSSSGLPLSGLAVGGRHISTGSYQVANFTGTGGILVGSVQAGILGSVQVSNITGALPAGTAILGSVKIEDGGNSITVDGTVTINAIPAGTALIGSVVADIVGLSTSDYISIVGSPNYNLPIIGSVTNSSSTPIYIVGSPNYNLPVSATVSTGSGMVIYSGAVTNIADVASGRLGVSALGSVQVSSIVGALPAGTSILGSVKADVNTVRDLLGSVQVSSILGALPAGTAVIGNIGSLGAGILGSVNVSSITAALPAGTVILGSVKADITKQESWFNVGSITIKQWDGSSVRASFDWVGVLTGSNIYATPAGSSLNLMDILASASGASQITLFWSGLDNLNARVAKTSLANYGGFVQDFSRPVPGFPGSPLLLSVSGTAPVGFITVGGFLTG